MRNVFVAWLIAAVASCSTPDRTRPNLGDAQVVPLAHQPADVVAARVCALLHGAKLGSAVDRAGGCTSREHANGHAADGTAHVSLTADARTNSIVLATPPGHAEDLARAIELIRKLDQPATGAKADVERAQPSPPAGSETIRLVHADAHDVARELNDLVTASYWKSVGHWKSVGRGCALPLPPVEFPGPDFPEPDIATLDFDDQQRWRPVDPDELVRLTADFSAEALREHLEQSPRRLAGPNVRPPPETFLPWDDRTLVVLEAHRDADYFAHVRELVHRLDADAPD